MAVTIVRLGDSRGDQEGLRIGTVRRPPRGVAKKDYVAKDIYGVWFPNLFPSESLLKEARPDLDLLAALSRQTNFAVSCYCEDESRCHRSILRDLLAEREAVIR